MPRNTEGLSRSARLRSMAAIERAHAAIQRMQSAELEINFRSVAAQAKVSTPWLYGTKPLRDRIMKLRGSSSSSAETDARARMRLSQDRIAATLRLRVKRLEEKNRELAELLEIAYGKLALTSEATSASRAHATKLPR